MRAEIIETTPAVDLVFTDLRDAFADLRSAAHSPKLVRRAFSRFVDLTQRLTNVMRKDYKALTGERWSATDFPGWTETTTVFKQLRNDEQHELPLHVSVEETRYYQVAPGIDQFFVMSGVWALTDQLANNPPEGMALHLGDPQTGAMLPDPLQVSRITYRFLLQPRDDIQKTLIQQLTSTDVIEMSNECMVTLAQYHALYGAKVAAFKNLQ